MRQAQQEGVARAPLPAILVITAGLDLFLFLAFLAATHAGNACVAIKEIVFLASLIAGRAWARLFVVVVAMLDILVIAMLLVVMRPEGPLRAGLAAELALDVWWLYVLSRKDVHRFFEERARSVGQPEQR